MDNKNLSIVSWNFPEETVVLGPLRGLKLTIIINLTYNLKGKKPPIKQFIVPINNMLFYSEIHIYKGQKRYAIYGHIILIISHSDPDLGHDTSFF
jgi:hypothetical protein